MYSMTSFEFRQYEMASKRLKEIQQKHAIEIEQAYESIAPTRVAFDYELGRMYSESVDTANYAIYLIDLKDEQKRIESYWHERANAYQKAVNMLSDDDKRILNNKRADYLKRLRVARAIKDNLNTIVANSPKLQRTKVIELVNVKDYDKEIDSMNEDELLEDYQDFIGS